MEGYKLRFTNTEIKKLLKENFIIICDTKEQVNDHILSYFDSKKIKYRKQNLEEGDYTAIITARPDMGIIRDIYFKVAVERKNSIDELAGNLAEKTDTRDNIRLERELMRAKLKGIKMFLVIEEFNGMKHIRTKDYRSSYSPKAFEGKLSSIQDKYLNDTIFCNPEDTGLEIVRKLYYAVRNFLKEGEVDLAAEESIL